MQGGFDGSRVGLQEVCVHQRKQPVMQRPCVLDVTGQEQVYQCRHCSWDLVRGDRNESVSTGSYNQQGKPVVSREDAKISRSPLQEAHDLLQITTGFLDTQHVGMGGEPERNLRRKVDGRASGYVIEADWPGGGVGDCNEVPVQAFLARS